MGQGGSFSAGWPVAENFGMNWDERGLPWIMDNFKLVVHLSMKVIWTTPYLWSTAERYHGSIRTFPSCTSAHLAVKIRLDWHWMPNGEIPNSFTMRHPGQLVTGTLP